MATPVDNAKRKMIARNYMLLEKERNNTLDEIDKTVTELQELGIKLKLDDIKKS